MKGIRIAPLVLLALAPVAGTSFADTQLIVYPAKGQTPEQQKQDQSECYTWAKGQSGFDPANPPAVQAPAPSSAPQGQVVRGAARGAVLGEIVSDDAGTGAAAGAAIGAMRRQDQKRAQQQQASAAQQQQQQYIAQKTSEFNRALTACLEARSYTVK
jgi:hypothetical protein